MNQIDPLLGATNGEAPHRPQSSRFTSVDPLRLLRQYLRVLIVVAVVGAGLGVGAWFAMQQFDPQYSTYAQLVASAPPPSAYGSLVEAGSATGADQMSLYIQNQVIRIRSDNVLLDALKNADVRSTSWYRSFYRPAWDETDPAARAQEAQDRLTRRAEPTSDAKVKDEVAAIDSEVQAERAALAKDDLQKGALTASQLRGSTLLSVAVTGSVATDLQKILNAVVNTYLSKLRLDGELEATDLRRAFLEEQKRAEDDFQQFQNQIKQFVMDNDLPNLQSQFSEYSIQYSQLASEEIKLQIMLQAARDSYQALLTAQREGSFNYTPSDRMRVQQHPTIASLDQRLRLLREDLEVLSHRYGQNHYTVKQIEARIVAAEADYKREYDRLLLEQQQVILGQAKNAADTMQAQVEGLLPKLVDARTKVRDINLKLQTYQNLAKQAENAELRRDKAQTMLDEVRIKVQRPDFIRMRLQQGSTPPELNRRYYIAPAVMMLIVGLAAGLIYLREMLDQRIKMPADLKALHRLEVLGVVPSAADDPTRPKRVETVVQDDPAGLMSESFRQLRTALLSQMDRRGYKTLMVASPSPESGASTVASNLAISLALIGRKVLLIDANFRRPTQHRIFDLPQQPGLVDVLHGRVAAAEVIVTRGEPGIDILPVGDARNVPPELLDGSGFRGLLAQLERQYDLIIIDSPPALLAAETQMLAKHADAMLVVVRAMADKRGMITRMLRQVEGMRADVLGAVLNGVRSSTGGYFRKSYEEFYRYNQPAPTPKGRGKRPTVVESRK
ncbi:MAG: polysaccharide biosynthesis tyrosine autokinase [Phycisphaeraceae bacterium]